MKILFILGVVCIAGNIKTFILVSNSAVKNFFELNLMTDEKETCPKKWWDFEF